MRRWSGFSFSNPSKPLARAGARARRARTEDEYERCPIERTRRPRRAVEWRPRRRPPHLAAVLSEELGTATLSRSIEDDPEYRAVMNTAAEIGAGAEVVSDVVARLVGRMIRTLL